MGIVAGLLILAQFVLAALYYQCWNRVWRYKGNHRSFKRNNHPNLSSDRTANALRVLQINVWSGSTYVGELDWRSCFSFVPYESSEHSGRRYEALVRINANLNPNSNAHPQQVRGVKQLDPDVITLNECMPCRSFSHRLATDLGMDCVARLGVAGLVFGWLKFPFISEGMGSRS